MIVVKATKDSKAEVLRKEGEIEVRQMFELEDISPSEEVECFRKIGIGTAK
jgi:hypothetical protein